MNEPTAGPHDPVIYCIQNTVTGTRYVGWSQNYPARRASHLREFRRGKHHGERFQRDWDFYGEEAFTFRILDQCDDDHWVGEQCEKDWLAWAIVVGEVYNTQWVPLRPDLWRNKRFRQSLLSRE